MKEVDKILCETQDGKRIWMTAENLTQRMSAYGILINQGGVLVVQTHLSLWEFPGGTPEIGETLLEGLKREFLEETGFIIKPKTLILERESFYCTPSKRVFHSLQHFFEVEQISGNIQSGDNLKIAWIAVDELLSKRNLNQGTLDALEALQGNRIK